MMGLLTGLAYVLVTVSSPSSAKAEAPLTLGVVVQRAIANNPDLRAAESEIDAARAREIQAAALPNPNLTLTVDQVPIPQPLEGNYMAGVTQPLLLSGQREARTELARLDTKLAELERATVHRELIGQVKDAYAGLLFELEGTRLARLNDAAAETHWKATRTRFQAGEVPPVEVLRAEVERSRTQRDVAVAAAREMQARGRLNVLLGEEAEAPIVVADLPLPTGATLPTARSLVAEAIVTRSEMRRAEVLIQREALQRRVAQTSLWTGTEAAISGGMVSGMPGFSTSLSIPMPFYRQQGEIAEADANRRRAEAKREALKNEITLAVERAYREAVLDADQVARFQRSYIPQAQTLLDNARRRFEAGEGSGIEVVEARRALHETRTAFRQAVLDYRQAITALESTVGHDLPASSNIQETRP